VWEDQPVPEAPCVTTGRDDQLVEEARLGGREVRLLVRAEEELEQTAGFSRLIPQPEGGVKYLKYLDGVGPADRLLAAWEARSGRLNVIIVPSQSDRQMVYFQSVTLLFKYSAFSSE
jgi:hypothetical protein